MPLPRSIAIIPDGNRRFAKKNGLSLQNAYWQGFEKMREAAEWTRDAGVSSLTMWALSIDNFRKRSKTELSVLFRLLSRQMNQKSYLTELVDSGTKVRFFGNRKLLPKNITREMAQIEEDTVENDAYFLNVGLAYSGRDELLNAARLIGEDYKNGAMDSAALTENAFERYLYLNETPDLIFRTGDAHRLSGLMPWQSVYSEIYFSKKLWPEITRRDYNNAIKFYESEDRRFGK
ncbi:MAG: polyprenyl diphosphate synthase [Candidatus Micrarchaeota archaeon]